MEMGLTSSGDEALSTPTTEKEISFLLSRGKKLIWVDRKLVLMGVFGLLEVAHNRLGSKFLRKNERIAQENLWGQIHPGQRNLGKWGGVYSAGKGGLSLRVIERSGYWKNCSTS